MINRIIHQIWHPFTASDMPAEWHRFSLSWKRCHPGWGHVLWGPEESRRFVAARYPDFVSMYDGYPSIKRVDALRVLLELSG